MILRWSGLLLAFGVLLSACGSLDDENGGSPPSTEQAEAPERLGGLDFEECWDAGFSGSGPPSTPPYADRLLTKRWLSNRSLCANLNPTLSDCADAALYFITNYEPHPGVPREIDCSEIG